MNKSSLKIDCIVEHSKPKPSLTFRILLSITLTFVTFVALQNSYIFENHLISEANWQIYRDLRESRIFISLVFGIIGFAVIPQFLESSYFAPFTSYVNILKRGLKLLKPLLTLFIIVIVLIFIIMPPVFYMLALASIYLVPTVIKIIILLIILACVATTILYSLTFYLPFHHIFWKEREDNKDNSNNDHERPFGIEKDL